MYARPVWPAHAPEPEPEPQLGYPQCPPQLQPDPEPELQLHGCTPEPEPDEQPGHPEKQNHSTTTCTDADGVVAGGTCVVLLSDAELLFRPIEPGDREAVKQLHEDWFPVRCARLDRTSRQRHCLVLQRCRLCSCGCRVGPRALSVLLVCRYEAAFYDRISACGSTHQPYFTMAAVVRSTGAVAGEHTYFGIVVYLIGC
jgi:hypothetical protein